MGNKPDKNSRTFYPVKFLKAQGLEKIDNPSKVRDALLNLTSPTNEKVTQYPVGIYGFLRQHIPHVSVLPWLIYQVPVKLLVLIQSQNKRKFCHWSKLLYKLLCEVTICYSRSNEA